MNPPDAIITLDKLLKMQVDCLLSFFSSIEKEINDEALKELMNATNNSFDSKCEHPEDYDLSKFKYATPFPCQKCVDRARRLNNERTTTT